MELRHLRYFVAVAEELHFGRAALRMRVSQPPLSRQVADLEREVGAQLLHRTSHRVELTAAGRAFLAEAQAILAAVDRAVANARDAPTEGSAALRIGFIQSAGWPLPGGVIATFIDRHPASAPVFTPSSSGNQLRAIRAGHLDVGVVWEVAGRRRNESDLDRIVLREHPLELAVAHNHPLAQRRQVPLREISQHPLLLPNRQENPPIHDAIVRALDRHHIRRRAIHVAGASILDLVAAGVGAAFFTAAFPIARGQDVVSLSLDPPPLIARLVLVWLRRNSLPALREFIAVVQEERHRAAARLA